MPQTYSGLQRAIKAAEAARPGLDAVDYLASALSIKRKTLLTWLREDGTPLGSARHRPDNRVMDAANKAGGIPTMARQLGVTSQAVREWVRAGAVPPARAKEIEMLYGIPRAELVSAKVRNAMGFGGEL